MNKISLRKGYLKVQSDFYHSVLPKDTSYVVSRVSRSSKCAVCGNLHEMTSEKCISQVGGSKRISLTRSREKDFE